MIAVMVWHAILHTHHGNTHIIAVGRGRRGEGGEEEEEEEKRADIKSNDPHLTGGGKKNTRHAVCGPKNAKYLRSVDFRQDESGQIRIRSRPHMGPWAPKR